MHFAVLSKTTCRFADFSMQICRNAGARGICRFVENHLPIGIPQSCRKCIWSNFRISQDRFPMFVETHPAFVETSADDVSVSVEGTPRFVETFPTVVESVTRICRGFPRICRKRILYFIGL